MKFSAERYRTKNRQASAGARVGRTKSNLDAQYARSAVFQGQTNAAVLLADAELLNDGLVAFGIRLSEVIEQTTPFAHHHEKTTPGGMIFLMRLKMLRQLANSFTQDCDLDLWRTGIGHMSAVLVNQGGFFLSC